MKRRIEARCVVDWRGREANRRINLARGLPILGIEPMRSGVLGIVGGGLSAVEVFAGRHDAVLAVSNAAAWLRSHGVVPDYHLLLDPRPAVARFVAAPSSQTRYLVATVCDPVVLDALAGHDVTLFEAADEDSDGVGGGPSSMTRAPVAARWLGWRRTRLYGADCCYGTASHIWGGEVPADAVTVEADGARYTSSWAMVVQAEYLAHLIPPLADEVVGEDHLTAAMLRTGGEWSLLEDAA